MLKRSSSKSMFIFTMCWRSLLVLVVILAYSSASTSPKPAESKYRKVCRGAVSAISHSHGSNISERYNMYKRQYTNCTHVLGNLAIQFLEEKDDYDMGFLKDIQEVSGFVLIIGNWFSHLNLTSLRVIRGMELFENQGNYSLYVALNYKKGSKTPVGLKELGLVSLQEIMAGGVYLYDNNVLCYEESILWKDIMTDEAELSIGSSNPSQQTCNECHESCAQPKTGDRHCWGEGPDMCQELTKVVCSEQCESRCFGPGSNECCRPDCAGGCSGPYKRDCFACRNFNDEGVCVAQCPPILIYVHNQYKYVPNPKGKYAFGNICVKECPDHLIADNGACVSDCRPGYVPEGRTCVSCNDTCPKSCPGTGDGFLNVLNIENFTECTVINGNLKILQSTFDGDPPRNLPGISLDQLSVFENVKEITNFLIIQGSHDQFTNLSFLSNLVTIRGLNTVSSQPSGTSLVVYGTSLTYLGLNSLKQILNGGVFVSMNKNLCYANSVNWSSIHGNRTRRIAGNGNLTVCEEEGNVCSPLCSSKGCWGPGDDQCLSCNGYRYGKRCTDSCENLDGYFKFETNETRECRKCHEECQGSCTGQAADQCHSCKHVRDGPFCVASCPPFKYADASGTCNFCHENCEGGCTGPDNTVGPGACNLCSIVVYDGEPLQPVKCLRPESDCETGFYSRYILSPNSPIKRHKHKACNRCHPECTECDGPDISYCSLSSCVHYIEGKRCVFNCSSDHYGDAEKQQCFQCDRLCLRCTGPTSSDCISCRDLKLYTDIEHREDDPSFTCIEKCPDTAPVKISDTYNGERDSVCVSEAYEQAVLGEPKKKQTGIIVGVIVGIAVIGIVVIIFVCVRRQIAKSKENQLRLTAKMTGYDDESEPLNPSDAKPDMSKMRLIQECELERENIIGSGAFGTVYKAAWKPSGENIKIPVAVKVLHESSPSQNKELLDEARIMASVDHQCCVRILAVCMTAQMMLVTQLMPLGCLLDYVRNNKKNIGSKVLLNWGTQIAKGMGYLESRGIVHRDLAARNVLVQSPNNVKITDFGLAKLLDYKQLEFQAAGGKMPIKWLALECIQHRIFTHKTDVWSFGITMWELFTYGQKPYENTLARDISSLLEKGERLPQPPICTIDVYMIMIKCWMLDAESRPSFQELADEFAKMARDPGRFLVIPGDELMKLPEQEFDTKDLLTEMTGPEQIMSADEYLQPQQFNHNHSVLKKGSNGDRNSSSAATHSNPNSDARTNGLESAASRSKRRDKTNSRYSSDPCKLLHAGTSDDGRASPSRYAEGGAGHPPSDRDVPTNLPIDDDDYLQPSLSSPSTYIEVIDSDTDNPHPGSVQAPSAISNPEYFEETANPSQGSNRQREMQPLKFRNPSTGSEADYYNEQDGLYNPRKGGQTDPRPYNESEV